MDTTLTRQALEKAREALELQHPTRPSSASVRKEQAIAAIDRALATAVQPVAHIRSSIYADAEVEWLVKPRELSPGTVLYASPAPTPAADALASGQGEARCVGDIGECDFNGACMYACGKVPSFQTFIAWAGEKGYDTAHTYDTDRCRWIALNPMTPGLWEAWQGSSAALATPSAPQAAAQAGQAEEVSLIDGILVAANNYADQRVMAANRRASEADVREAHEHLREVVEASEQVMRQRLASAAHAPASGQPQPLTDAQIDIRTSHIYEAGRPVSRAFRVAIWRDAERHYGLSKEQP